MTWHDDVSSFLTEMMTWQVWLIVWKCFVLSYVVLCLVSFIHHGAPYWLQLAVGYACKERERVGLLTLICSFLPIKKRGDRENDLFLRHFFFIPTIASMCLSQHHDNDSLPSVILRQSLHFSLKIPFTG
ncbi:hypothetical protein Hanom_Chr04g00297621 [Helianthus anomalus]